MGKQPLKPLLINFVGSPASGKTTVAASVFADLKESGTIAEFISEEARKYIVQKKLKNLNAPTILNEVDQDCILIRQLDTENGYCKVCSPETVIVSDSSPLNTILYSSDILNDASLMEAIKGWLLNDPLIFYCPLIDVNVDANDLNRLHSSSELVALDGKCLEMLKALGVPYTTVEGSAQARKLQVLRTVYQNTERP